MQMITDPYWHGGAYNVQEGSKEGINRLFNVLAGNMVQKQQQARNTEALQALGINPDVASAVSGGTPQLQAALVNKYMSSQALGGMPIEGADQQTTAWQNFLNNLSKEKTGSSNIGDSNKLKSLTSGSPERVSNKIKRFAQKATPEAMMDVKQALRDRGYTDDQINVLTSNELTKDVASFLMNEVKREGEDPNDSEDFKQIQKRALAYAKKLGFKNLNIVPNKNKKLLSDKGVSAKEIKKPINKKSFLYPWQGKEAENIATILRLLYRAGKSAFDYATEHREKYPWE